MAPQTLFSAFNLASIVTVTASGSAAGYPASNITAPQRLTLPWRSTSIAVDQWLVLDNTFGVIGWGPGGPLRVCLLGANFTSCVIQEHSADAWGAPDFTTPTLTVTQDPQVILYRRWVAAPGNLSRRYLRILIPAQATTNGAAYFELAGVWMGQFFTIARGLSPRYETEMVTPAVTQTAALGGWSVSYETGDRFVRHRWERTAEKNPSAPWATAPGNQLYQWHANESAWQAATGRRFCYCLDNWGTGAVWVMRQTNQTNWKDDGLTVARDRWELEECVAG